MLARALRVKERLPHFDGARLDDIVDYLTYVFVPALIVWQAELVPVALPICAAMLLSSAYGFAPAPTPRLDSQRSDHFFTGFPSYWNIVAVYLYVAQAAAAHQRDHSCGARGAGVRADSLPLPVAHQDLEDADARAGHNRGRRCLPG